MNWDPEDFASPEVKAAIRRVDSCPQCKGEGFYFRLPPGMNPFVASIEVTARNMRRIQCHCPAGRALLASNAKGE